MAATAATRLLAITHAVPRGLGGCELSFRDRRPIDVARAVVQHADYCRMLRDRGAEVRTVVTSPDHPDAAFVEDTAIVLDELAIAASMGTVSRGSEVANILPVLAEYRAVERVERVAPPATIEGGDVLRIGRTLYAGQTSRTNVAGIDALRRLVEPRGYRVVAVDTRDCLHLKTACTALDDATLLANPAWVDMAAFGGLDVLAVPESEPWGANALRVGDTVCLSAAHPRTAERVQGAGFAVRTVDVSEFEKAEAGVTCLSLLVAGAG